MKVTYSGMLAPLTQADMNSKAMRLEEALKLGPTLDLEVTHTFGGDVYARQLYIPKGVTVVGEIHRTENLNMLIKGEISVTTDDGVKRLKAPAVIVAQAGAKRVGYAHEDTIWVTLHATKERDIEKIKSVFIAPCFEALASSPETIAIEGE